MDDLTSAAVASFVASSILYLVYAAFRSSHRTRMHAYLVSYVTDRGTFGDVSVSYSERFVSETDLKLLRNYLDAHVVAHGNGSKASIISINYLGKE